MGMPSKENTLRAIETALTEQLGPDGSKILRTVLHVIDAHGFELGAKQLKGAYFDELAVVRFWELSNGDERYARRKIVTALKEYKCVHCAGTIVQGERHLHADVFVTRPRADRVRSRYCCRCCVAIERAQEDGGKELESRRVPQSVEEPSAKRPPQPLARPENDSSVGGQATHPAPSKGNETFVGYGFAGARRDEI